MSIAPVVIVTGSPGVGKTTTAQVAADRFDASAHIVGDHFFRYVRGGAIDPSLPESDEQNRQVMAISGATATAYARTGRTTFLEGIYGPWFLDDVRDAIDVPSHYVVLRAPLDTCVQRALARHDERGDDGLEHRDRDDLVRVVRQMHPQFLNLGKYERFIVSADDRSPEEIADAVLARLAAGELLLG
ncbi:MAG: AAA family ATPase [Actinomycetota bacterium]